MKSTAEPRTRSRLTESTTSLLSATIMPEAVSAATVVMSAPSLETPLAAYGAGVIVSVMVRLVGTPGTVNGTSISCLAETVTDFRIPLTGFAPSAVPVSASPFAGALPVPWRIWAMG